MTDAEMVVAAKVRLTELAQRALQMHRTLKTREFIVRTHNRWNYELASVNCAHAPLPDHTVEAFTELQETTALLVTERGHDPDSVLHWLDMYPALVVTVYLGVKQPHTV